jgi:hypothetical protein
MAGAAAALTLLQSKDPAAFENAFKFMTPSSLELLHNQLAREIASFEPSGDNDCDGEGVNIHDQDCRRVIALAIIRRLVHKCLRKYSEISAPEYVEEALKYHILPDKMQKDLTAKFGGTHSPKTWYDALEQIRQKASNKSNLWELILDHPLTAYVPVQCQFCGHIIPDDVSSVLSDAELGLAEEDPTPEEEPWVRAGWFRGPRGRNVFVLTCQKCLECSRWWRSRDPKIILNPNRWGRLCGEQEDLRLDLANYLGISIRTVLPLDWDHVWSEFEEAAGNGDWTVHDNSARNFAVRLEEGIGIWTGVLAISPNPDLCEDVTEMYLSCQREGGRVDDQFATDLLRYRELVSSAIGDESGTLTQAGTINGYILKEAGFTGAEITKELRRASKEFGTKAWYIV